MGWGNCANEDELQKEKIDIKGALARIYVQDGLASCATGSGDNGRGAAHLASIPSIFGRKASDANNNGSHGFFGTVRPCHAAHNLAG